MADDRCQHSADHGRGLAWIRRHAPAGNLSQLRLGPLDNDVPPAQIDATVVTVDRDPIAFRDGGPGKQRSPPGLPSRSPPTLRGLDVSDYLLGNFGIVVPCRYATGSPILRRAAQPLEDGCSPIGAGGPLRPRRPLAIRSRCSWGEPEGDCAAGTGQSSL